ncbi:MAG: DUF1318 domain-containing protein [Alphaproteobacteria bacterium]|nr:DUF1318 domain-containing protein [Alphaproteobacteria bacterium]
MKTKLSRLAMLAGAIPLALGIVAVPVAAQDYASVKAAGLIGEKVDGYVAVVGSGGPELRRVVDDTNIKRRVVYAEKAQALRVTIEEYAFATACTLIAKTTPGEKYQVPDGSWQTRTAAPPVRDARCP